MKLKFFLILGKKIFHLNWIYLHKIIVTMYSIPYTRANTYTIQCMEKGYKLERNNPWFKTWFKPMFRALGIYNFDICINTVGWNTFWRSTFKVCGPKKVISLLLRRKVATLKSRIKMINNRVGKLISGHVRLLER